MASTSSINSSSSGSQAPNPPPRTHSRPNQPPPPPPLPSVPPVPPTRDSSINISKAAIIQKNSLVIQPGSQAPISDVSNLGGTPFLSQFHNSFKPIHELPLPEPFMNKQKSYPSQKSQQKQSTRSLVSAQ